MLEGLRPVGHDEDDDDDEEALDSARPQFVLGEEISHSGAASPSNEYAHALETKESVDIADKKAEIETVENAAPVVLEEPLGRQSVDENGKPKSGWKEVV